MMNFYNSLQDFKKEKLLKAFNARRKSKCSKIMRLIGFIWRDEKTSYCDSCFNWFLVKNNNHKICETCSKKQLTK